MKKMLIAACLGSMMLAGCGSMSMSGPQGLQSERVGAFAKAKKIKATVAMSMTYPGLGEVLFLEDAKGKKTVVIIGAGIPVTDAAGKAIEAQTIPMLSMVEAELGREDTRVTQPDAKTYLALSVKSLAAGK